MRLPDRPEAGNLDARQRDLAERLLRLPDGHPSSPRGDWPPARDEDTSGPEHGAAEFGSAAAGQSDRTARDGPAFDADPVDDALTGQALTDEGLTDEDLTDEDPADLAPGAPGRTAGRPTVGAGRDAGHDLYQPWFAGGGSPEPWFAAGQDGPGGLTPDG